MKKSHLFYFSTVFFYLYLPIAVLVINAFNVNRYGLRWDGFTFKWFVAMFNNPGLMEAARNSLIVALCSASIATLLGAFGAIGIYLYRFRGRLILKGALLTMMMIPDIIFAIALLVLFMMCGVSLGFWSLLLAHTSFCLPFTVVTILARLQGFDPFLLDAAQDLGASESQVLRKILLPLLLPALIASWLLCFTLSLDDVIVSSFVTGPSFDVLPLKIFSMVKVGVKPEVNALAAIMVLIPIVLVVISQYLIKVKK